MKKILVARIDDRLIHGQVVTAWIKTYPINKIVIIDNELSQNKLMQRVYKAAVHEEVEVSIFNQVDGSSFLKEKELINENIMIIVKTPNIIEGLLSEGIPLSKVVLGGMGANHSRKKFTKNISASEAEIESFRNIINQGVELVYQMVPSEKEIDIKNLV